MVSSPLAIGYTALYNVSPVIENTPAFSFWYELDSPHIHHRVLGEYETEVVEELIANLDEQDDFWEVGAGWGYHSLLLSESINRAVAFDPDESRTELLRRSIDRNDFDNISIVEESVLSLDDYVDQFGTPNVVLMDIDGWEYEVLPSSEELLNTDCTWIIELHHDVDVQAAEGRSPEEIEDLFQDYGYNVTRIREHYQQSWPGRKLDELNTHHIVASR